MNNSRTNSTQAPEPNSIELDLRDLDLSKIASLKGTALEAIVQELNEDAGCGGGQSKHHSHHSYSTHGTAAW